MDEKPEIKPAEQPQRFEKACPHCGTVITGDSQQSIDDLYMCPACKGLMK